MKKKKKGITESFNGDFALRIFILILCIAYFVIAIPYKQSAKFVPQLIASVTFVLTSLTFLEPIVSKKKAKDGSGDNSKESEQESKERFCTDEVPDKIEGKNGIIDYLKSLPKWIPFLALTIMYFIILIPIGYILSTFIYMCVAMFLIGHKNRTTIFVFSAVFTLVVYFCFKYLFHVALPSGLIG